MSNTSSKRGGGGVIHLSMSSSECCDTVFVALTPFSFLKTALRVPELGLICIASTEGLDIYAQ